MGNLNKRDLLVAMAAHVRANGLAGASLRPLARAAGTSDRMLIYHFGSKDGLISDLLDYLADELTSGLNAALPEDQAETEAECVQKLVELLRTPTFRPYVNVWFDILSATAQEDGRHKATAERILTGMINLIKARLPDGLENPAQTAQEILTLVQGVLVMDVAGLQGAADVAMDRFLTDA